MTYPAIHPFRRVRGLSRTTLLASLLIALLAAAGCGARSQVAPSGLDAWRQRAMDSEDPDVWLTLASYEWLADGGEPDSAQRSLERAEQLGGPSLRSHLLAGEMHTLHGEPELAFERFSKALEAAAGQNDALSTWGAEVALHALSDMNGTVADYRARMSAVADALAPRAAALGPHVHHDVTALRYQLARAAGDADKAHALWREQGCVQEMRVAGPFGPREMLSFDEVQPAEAPGPLADSYDLGPRREDVATRTLRTRQCVLGLGRDVQHPQGGSFVALGEVDVKQAGAQVLRVETPNSFVVWVDDKEVARVDTREKLGPAAHLYALSLDAGKHSVRVKVTSRHPNPALRLLVTPDAGPGLRGDSLPEDDDPLLGYLAAKLALTRGDVVVARELSAPRHMQAPTAARLILYAAATLADPLRAGDLRRDGARAALRRAQAQDPRAWYPPLTLANLEAADGRVLESLQGLRAVRKRWPDVLAVHLSLIQRLEQRGWMEAADQALAEASEHFPDNCTLRTQQLESELRRERAPAVAELTKQVMACDATRMARYAWLQRAGKGKAAADELTRLETLSDVPHGVQAFNTDIMLASLRGDTEQETALRMERASKFPTQASAVLDKADLLLASKGDAAARDYLAEAIAGEPDALYDLRSSYEALGGSAGFESLRVRGSEVIAAYEKVADQYDQPQVLVLDYTVMRVLSDGSSLDLTHNIIRVQSQEAVDAVGEWTAPDGARLLKLRTVKADGRRLEPDPIEGKDSYSLPNLSPGDYVEFEFVRASSPSVGFPDGYMADRFYFKSFEVPFHRSELVLVLPADTKPVIESRGDAPEAQRSELDGDQVLRFVAEQSQPLEEEPDSVPAKEFLPSVLVGYQAHWSDYVASLRDLLSDKAPHDPAAEAQVTHLLKDVKGDSVRERVKVLHHWVTEEVSPTDELFGIAPAMWASRTGSRDRVLHYLLQLAGIHSELVMVRSRTGDHAEAKLPDPNTYGFLLLRVDTEEGPLWLSTSDQGAPLSYVPEALRGEPGLVLNAKAERTQVPEGEPGEERHSVALEVWPKQDGSATFHVRETLRGSGAVSWRNDLRAIPEAELEARFESGYVAQRFSGGQMTELEVSGMDDPEEPIVLDYRVEQANAARREGDQWVYGGLFTQQLAARYARVATRETTQVVGPSSDLDVRVEIHLPKGAQLEGLPAELEVGGPGGAHFESRAAQDGELAVLERSLRIPFMRVLPDHYDQLATFCRAVDVAEDSEVRLLWP